MGTGSTVNYVHADGLNTPHVITDATGTTVWQWSLQGNPFGEQAPAASAGYVFNLRFPGQYADAESGLVHNGFRDYCPACGRYIQSDPTGLDGGLSTYGYVSSSPLSAVDPLGLQNENERDLLEPIDVAGPVNTASYLNLLRQIRQYEPDFQDPIMSRGEPVYTRDDVLRLEGVLRGEAMQGCRAPGTNRRGEVTSRTTYRKPVVQAAWDSAEPGPTGGRLCPTCGTEVNVPPNSGQPRDWDMSHYPSWSNRWFPTSTTRQEVRDNYQQGTRLECPGCNRSGGNNDERFHQ